jgi:hypothetical protein
VRVTWVHPSWRDLVIDHLSSDEQARAHFLRHCHVHGALLALSSAGGSGGQRLQPLLRRDADWDMLTDRLYDLAPELEHAELVGVLDALRVAPGPALAEAHALSRAFLARVAAIWNASRAPVALPALEAWLSVGKRLSPRPEPPALGVTWAELLPIRAPDFADRASLGHFADWLTLAELLLEYDDELLVALRFPAQSLQPCQAFLDELSQSVQCLDPRDVDQAVQILAAMVKLVGPLTERAYLLRGRLEDHAQAFSEPALEVPWAAETGSSPRGTGHLDVQRVLEDL